MEEYSILVPLEASEVDRFAYDNKYQDESKEMVDELTPPSQEDSTPANKFNEEKSQERITTDLESTNADSAVNEAKRVRFTDVIETKMIDTTDGSAQPCVAERDIIRVPDAIGSKSSSTKFVLQ